MLPERQVNSSQIIRDKDLMNLTSTSREERIMNETI